MRWLPLCLLLAGALVAQAPLQIVAVERRGPPPYEAVDRIYRLDGGQDRGLHVGDRLLVKRLGEASALGHLRVTEVRGEHSEARFEPASSRYPMKGDLALKEELKAMPSVPPLEVDPLPQAAAPSPGAVAPPREGLLYFLPQRADLSPAGRKKLEAWVQAWGVEGRWVVQVPAAKALNPALQKQRGESIVAVLRTLGIRQVAVETQPRTAEGRHDPAWVRHWD